LGSARILDPDHHRGGAARQPCAGLRARLFAAEAERVVDTLIGVDVELLQQPLQ
jgi:hypothetical protein